MTEPLFREDAYLRHTTGRVVELTDRGIILDRSVFYATGGGQPGDRGRLVWSGGSTEVETCVKGEGDALILVPA